MKKILFLLLGILSGYGLYSILQDYDIVKKSDSKVEVECPQANPDEVVIEYEG